MQRKESQIERLGRRRLLKILGVAGGAVATSTLVPGQWVKPVVQVGLLPAHAAISLQPPFGPAGSLTVTATWTDNDNDADIDLIVVEPGGTVVHPFWGVTAGTTAIHSGDVSNGTGPETVTVPADGAIPGTYGIYLANDESNAVTVTVTVTTEAGTAIFNRVLTSFASNSGTAYVANINFPGGAPAEQTGSIPPGIIPGLPLDLESLPEGRHSRKKR